MNARNQRTAHPRKSARREGALFRLSGAPSKDQERGALISRIGKPPRAWLAYPLPVAA